MAGTGAKWIKGGGTQIFINILMGYENVLLHFHGVRKQISRLAQVHYEINSFNMVWHMCVIRRNLSKADTLGINIFFCFRKVSALDRLGLWDFDK